MALVPGYAIHDGLVAQSLIAALAAAALAFVGFSARAADVNFAAQVTRYFRLAAAVPAIWMAIQILPIPSGANSIWINTNEALDQQAWGRISVDIGATVEALTFYLANVSLIVVSIFVASDRRRAELTLFALTGITTLTVLVLLIAKSVLIAGAAPSETREVLSAASALGVVLSLTSGLRAIERYESAERERPAKNIRAALGASGVGLLCCMGGLASSATAEVAITAAFGAITFGSIQAVRRADLANWATGILVATMITAASMIILWRYDTARALSPFLQFASAASPDAISIAQRLLSDTAWLGTGAGTYGQLLPIYQGLDSSVTGAPTTASAFTIELGRPMAIFIIVVTVGLVIALYRGALARGRDSFYSAAAAACGVVIFGQAFCDTSLLNSGIAVIGDAVIGLGLAQSIGRRDSP